MYLKHPHIQYASFKRRLLAFILDMLIIGFVSTAAVLLVFGSNTPAANHGDTINWMNNGFEQLFQLIWVIGCWLLWQATQGKMLMDIKIVDEQTLQAPKWHKLILRYFAYILSSIPLGLGYVWIVFDKKNRAWHDRLAKTVVIVDDDSRLSLNHWSRQAC